MVEASMRLIRKDERSTRLRKWYAIDTVRQSAAAL